MEIEKIVESISAENIYSHVLHLEGIRHPIANPSGLNSAADYINSQLSIIGFEVSEHVFHLDGIDMPFRNIEGVINLGTSSEVLITAHYDTVKNSPGADDNAGAVAAMIEAARILAESGTKKAIRCVGFTLEEGNPVLEKRALDVGKRLMILDSSFRHLTYHTDRICKKHSAAISTAYRAGHVGSEAWAMADREIEVEATSDEKRYLEELRSARVCEDEDTTARLGTLDQLGSSIWARMVSSEGRRPAAVINLETVGYTSRKPNSQQFPPGLDIKALPQHKVDLKGAVGDFIAIVSDKQSVDLGQMYFTQCARNTVDLPALFFALPHDIGQIAKGLPDALRSDHAPFWLEGIPAIMVTNTANFRSPFYHTPGDTIDRLDFDFIRKVCQATVLAALEL